MHGEATRFFVSFIQVPDFHSDFFALLSLPAFFFLTDGSRLSSTFFESTVRSIIYRNEKNGAVVVTQGYNREGIALVEESLKFKFNYLTNSGVLYRNGEPKFNSLNDPDLRNRVADWTERALLWEKLTAGIRRGRTPAGVSRQLPADHTVTRNEPQASALISGENGPL